MGEQLILPGMKKLVLPNGPAPELSAPAANEVKQWGMLVGWLRKKGYTPSMVRGLVELCERNGTEIPNENKSEDKNVSEENKTGK